MAIERRLTILVVDDERVIADSLAEILCESGYAATPAYSGQAALEKARALSPDIIISDVMMPGLTGTEMVIQARQFLPDCKVLLVSGQTTTGDLLENAAAQGYTFQVLPKPFAPRELLAKLRELTGMGA